jgi:putative (di)nucleoside polyphosphate hydrolase
LSPEPFIAILSSNEGDGVPPETAARLMTPTALTELPRQARGGRIGVARSPSKKTWLAAGAQASGPDRARPPSAYDKAKFTEPDLVMLLAEPEVRLIMRADHVDERELRAMLDAVSVELRNSRSQSKMDHEDTTATPSNELKGVNYRPGVGIVLINQRHEVFVGRRIDVKNDAWQMPQGGIERGESPRQAALRELKEEIGTDNVDILGESKGWLYYDVPSALAEKAWGRHWQGQHQKWFVMLFKGQDSAIDLATKHPEFNAWRWIPLEELSALAVSFKRQLYLNVLGEFATLFRD